MSNLVFQDWILPLPMQQQSVLVLALRGPDNIGKFHVVKRIVMRYRATVLKAAYYGRPLRPDEGEEIPTFMTLEHFRSERHWLDMVEKPYFDHVDELPHHYHMHLMHGAQIIGEKHPDQIFRERWWGFYLHCCADLHLNPEHPDTMNERLNDWDQEHWNNAKSLEDDEIPF